ncbi:glycosyltransferase [Sciscionella sediminilitoris]|uniref:glycosyltransferase n=1 Tax=Sciscionella sediminilitoris TaxID=1445613 RepID=UPI0004DF6795|nr:glycosyltransferase [Sciscionella sp. SE31]
MIAWLVIGGVSLAAWLWLLLCRGFFWRTGQRLPRGGEPRHWPSVAIVVPARDEAAVLPESLPSLLDQRYPGRVEVILVDDGSTDGTGALASRMAAEHGGLPLRVGTPGEPPPGWAGKLWALDHGITAAGAVDYLLLTDADIAHEPDSLARLVAAAHEGRDLVSQMARLRTDTGWERLIVPAFVYFFAMLYPFRWVNRMSSRAAAGAGGCVLVRRAALAEAGGVAAIRGAVIDDVALARLIKGAGGRIWLGLAQRVRSVRPYPRLADLWQMIARSAYTQLRYSPLLLAGTVLGLALIFLGPPAATIAGAVLGAPLPALLGGAAWLLLAATFAPMLRYYRQPVWIGPLLPAVAVLYTLMTLDSARRHYSGAGARWKGRTYSKG